MAYSVQGGDTLTKIAKKNNTTVDALMAANPNIKNANLIYVGQSINVPKPATAPAATTTAVKPQPSTPAPLTQSAPKPAVTNTAPTSVIQKPSATSVPTAAPVVTKLPATTAPAPLTNISNKPINDSTQISYSSTPTAPAGQKPATSPAPTNAGQNNPSLRSIASQLGFNVDTAGGMITVTNPQSGQQISFKANEGEQYGISDMVNYTHGISDLAAFEKALGYGQTQKSDTEKQLESLGITGDQLLSKLDGLMNNTAQPSLQELYSQINNMLPTVPNAPPVLSYDQALLQSKSQMNPLYDESSKKINEAMDYKNIASGFYGQMPGDVVKAEALAGEESNRNAAIAQLAQQLVGQSETNAQNIKNSNMQEQSSRLNSIMGMFQQLSSNRNQSIGNILQALGLVNAQTNANRDYLTSIQDMNLKQAYYFLDNKVKTGELTIAQRDQAIREKDAAAARQLETDKFSWQKEIEGKQLDYQQAKMAIDKAIEEGRLSVQAGQLALQKNEFTWAQNPDNPDNIYKVSEANKNNNATKTAADQEQADKVAREEAAAQEKNGSFVSWFKSSLNRLRVDLSSRAYAELKDKYNGLVAKEDQLLN